MKNLFLKTAALLLIGGLIFESCTKEDDPQSNDVIKKYAGSGSEGDLITFDVNQTDNSYTIYNETTGATENGNYTVMTDKNDLSGIYHIVKGSSDFYAVELDDKIIAANFPTGNPNNNISFGVSSDINNIGNTSNIAGDYVYMIMDNDGIMNDPSIKEWGILNLQSNNTWIKKGFASNTGDGSIPEMSPEIYTGSLPITSGDETGAWTVNGTNKERLDVTIDGISTTLTGYVYADINEAAFLLDLGTGNGFLIGLKINNNSSFSAITGDYKFVNVWDNGYGAGNYAVNSSGIVNWTHQGSDAPTNGSFQLNQCTNVFKNIYYSDNVDLGNNYFEKLYCIVVGDIILQFGFDNSNGDFSQYGIGAKID